MGATATAMLSSSQLALPLRRTLSRRLERVSPDISSAASRAAPSMSTSSRLISYVICAPSVAEIAAAGKLPGRAVDHLYVGSAHADHRVHPWAKAKSAAAGDRFRCEVAEVG